MNDQSATTILIADDDPSVLLLAEAALAGAGFMVHTAADGAEALQRFAEVVPDIVILDVDMPKTNGIEACREIRQQAGSRLVPILMLTGRNDLPAISQAYAAGANDFAQKGMNPRLLVERVRFLLRDRAMQEEIRSSRSKLLLAQSIARVGHWELNPEGATVHLSPMIGELLGVDAQALGRYEEFIALLEPAERSDVRAAFVTCATGNGRFSFDHRIKAADGRVICVHQEAELIEGSGGSNERVVIVTLQDLTRLHEAEETVRLLSYFDTDTKLPNRRHLEEQVAQALHERSSTAAFAAVAFRVLAFDRITQAQGSAFAQQLLSHVARRIETELGRICQGGTILWRTDLPSVCRTADGELSLLLRSRVSSEHVATVVHAVLESLSKQAVAPDVDFVPAVSAGVALAEGSSVTAEQLLANAHAAAELATDPRGCAFFSPLPQVHARRRLLMESALRGAVERRELHLVFQPRMTIDTFDLTGVECQVRWESPQFGAVKPDELAALADEAGIGDDIGRWMLEESCRQLAIWHERYDRHFFVANTLSSRQLRDPNLVGNVQSLVQRHKLTADSLQIETREASLIDAPDAAVAALIGLRKAGVRIGIDDFGTGHSSLGLVRRVPFDSMKLDRALMADLYTDPWAQGVTSAVLAMARAMKIRAVCDGIDDAATVQMLQALGCDELQGPYVAKAMKVRDFEEWLEDGGPALLSRKYQNAVSGEAALSGLGDTTILKWGNS
jgi:EAL domain-containing protein (putative c-di-GMP-specific phosphodiesterase class I)/DNA-binding response OmpR family regulator/GGDEF domain-containing protein